MGWVSPRVGMGRVGSGFLLEKHQNDRNVSNSRVAVSNAGQCVWFHHNVFTTGEIAVAPPFNFQATPKTPKKHSSAVYLIVHDTVVFLNFVLLLNVLEVFRSTRHSHNVRVK